MFIIRLALDGEIYYFSHEHRGVLKYDPQTRTTTTEREPEGIFSQALKDAQIFKEKFNAEFVASAYDGAEVISIEEIEGVLK